MNDAGGDRTEILFRLQEEIERLDASGTPIDSVALAARFGLTRAEVERSIAGIAALRGPDGPSTIPAAEDPAPATLSPPPLPPDYEMLGELGRGGMGVVYKVRQRSLDRVIAVKVLRPGDLLLGDVLRRFRKEARSLARLRHPHIVSIHEVGDAAGLLYFTMDFIDGEPLSEPIRRGDLTPSRAVRLLRQVTSAIAYSHGQGVVHRDLKPGNILIDANGDAFVVDFGLAQDAAAVGDHTVSGLILGTPAYMSPEQARGATAIIGERSDVYALGAILYECLTGRPPFRQKGLAELVHAVLHEEPRAPRRLKPDVPLDLELICRKAMAKEPERRYATANALLEDLERFHDGRPVTARAPSPAYRAARFARRHWQTLALGAAVATALVVAFVAIVLPQVRPPAAATMAAAATLAESGEHRAALVLLDRARGESGAAAILDELRSRAVAALLALLERELAGPAPELGAAQALLERAANDAIAMERDQGRTAVVARAWELAARAQATNAPAVSVAATDVVDRVLAARHVVGPRGPHLGRMLTFALGANDPRDLLDRLLPALRDDADPLHAVATRYVVGHVVELAGAKQEIVVTWVLAEAGRDPRVLRPLFAAIDRLPPRDGHRLVGLLAGRRFDPLLRPAVGRRLLAELAADPSLGPLARTVAVDLLAAKADLPIRAPRDPEWQDLPAAAPRLIAPLLALGRAVAEVDRATGFDLRVSAAIAAPELERLEVRRWLYQHTLGAPGRAPEAGTPAAWRDWWATAAKVAPAERLTRELGLPAADPPDPPALLQRFLTARDDERAALHNLLWLTVPARPGEDLPVSPSDERTPELWWRAVHGDAPRPEFDLRVAAMAWRDGETEPELAWEEIRTVQLFESVQPRRTGSLPPLPVAFGTPRVPGLDPRPGAAANLIEERLAVQVRWTRRGEIELVAEGPIASDMVRTTHVHSQEHDSMFGVRQGCVGLAGETVVPTWADQRGGYRALCVSFAPATDGTAQPWGLAGWRARVAEALRRDIADIDPQAGDGHPALFDAANALELATRIPVPEALADMRQVQAALEDSRAANSRFVDHLLRARLLLGDADALGGDRDRFAARMPMLTASDTHADDDTRFWAHVLLRAQDSDLQREAASRLHAEHLSAAMAARIAALGESARAGMSDGVRHRVATASPLLDAWLEPSPIAVPSWLALLLGGIGSAAALSAAWWRRRPGPRASAMLLLGGTAILTFDVAIAGVPLLPDPLGYVLLALGAWARRSHRAVPWLFAAAAATDLLAPIAFAAMPSVTVTLVAVAVILLPLGPRDAHGGRAATARWLCTALALAAFAYGVGPPLFLEWWARIGYGSSSWVYLGDPTWHWARQAVPLGALALLLALLVVGSARAPDDRGAR